MTTFVLVHGAWHGGWCWRQVREILEKRGHTVFTPTLTGIGERAHLISAGITMDTVIQDIANVLRFEDLHDVVLVGHSFAGPVISGVAECEPDRVNQLIYLDSTVLEGGETLFDCFSPEVVAIRRRQAEETSGGLSVPVPSAKDLGILDEAQWAAVEPFLRPHPISTYTSPLRLKNTPGDGFPCSYIVCTDPIYPSLEWARKRVEGYGWKMIPIATGHDAMISAPMELSELLIGLSEQ